MLRTRGLVLCLCAAVSGAIVIMRPQLLRTQTEGRATETPGPVSAIGAAPAFPTVAAGEAPPPTAKPEPKTSVASVPGSSVSKADALSPASAKRLLDLKAKAPLFLRYLRSSKVVFIENRGQFDAHVKFQVRLGSKVLWLTPSGIVFDTFRTAPSKREIGTRRLSGVRGSRTLLAPSVPTAFQPRARTAVPQQPSFERLVFSEKFIGAAASSPVTVNCPQPGIYNYFSGRDPKKWVKDVHGYSQVAYPDLWKGIDLKLYGNGSDVEQEFEIRPNADVSQIRVAYNGIKGLEVAKDGSLVVHTAFGDLRESKPRVYQEIAGKRVSVAGRFALNGITSYGFEVNSRNKQYALVIDPTLLYSTYLGGSNTDEAVGIAVDSGGNAYVTGLTYSTNFPTTQGALEAGGSNVAFVTKLNPLGSQLVYSTELGLSGSGTVGGAHPFGIAVDASGEAYITGYAGYGFPTTSNAFQATCGDFESSMFLTKLSSGGDVPLYSTCLGYEGLSTAYGAGAFGVAVGPNGDAYLTGSSGGSLSSGEPFPTTPDAFQPTAKGFNAFVAVINPAASGTASLVYSTYLGGSTRNGSIDAGRAIAVDASGMVYVAGQIGSETDFPTTVGAFQTQLAEPRSCQPAFVAKLNPSAAGSGSLIYSTFLGGSLGALATSIAVDSAGSAYVTGNTGLCAQACGVSGCTPNPVPFPTTTGAFQSDEGFHTAFVTKFNAAGSAPVYSTIVGSSTSATTASASGIALDSYGDAYVVGSARCVGNRGFFPVTSNPFQRVCLANGGDNAFLTELNSSGSGLLYSTYIGGSGIGGSGNVGDYGNSIAVDAVGDAYVTGSTTSSNFPVTSGAFQLTLPNLPGWSSAFVTKFPLGAPQGLSILGITPSVGGNAGSITPQIVGSGFHAGATVELTGAGGRVLATGVSVGAGGRTMNATFDLTNAEPGPVDLVVTNPDGTSATLPDALTIQQGGAPSLQIVKVGQPAVAGRDLSYFISISNTGNVDATGVLTSEYVEPWFTYLSASPGPTEIVTSEALFPPPITGAQYDAILNWQVPILAAGSATSFIYTAKLDAGVPEGFIVRGDACTGFEKYLVSDNCGGAYELCNTAAVVACVPCGAAGIAAPALCAACVSATLAACHFGRNFCISQTGGACSDNAESTVSSVDPNNLAGPTGAGTQRWVQGRTPIPYVISFGNEAAAQVPAQKVVVTDPLDPNLDPSSITLGPTIANGRQVSAPSTFIPGAGLDEFSTDLDFRPTQNLLVNVDTKLDPTNHVLTWTFTSIDPTTGQPPTDSSIGFLPPGAGGGVWFTATPNQSAPTGTIISNQASVVFDANNPVKTNAWANVIDRTPPTSQVAALPADETSSCFKVQWSGTDVGSGVQSYSIFVSDNGGAYTAWQTNTTATSAIYNGQPGHTYAFYSQAQDLVGNVEAAKTSPDTTTTVPSGATCGTGTPSLAGTITSKLSSAAGLTVTLQLTNDGQGNAQNITISQINLRTLSGTGTVTLANPPVPISAGNLAVGASTSVTLTLNVPSTVSQFSIVELGSLQNASGTSYNFGIAQVVYPSQ